MKLSESLIFLVSEAKCSIEPCKEMEWKLPSQRSGSVRVLGLYERGMLMTASLPYAKVVFGPCAEVVLGCS